MADIVLTTDDLVVLGGPSSIDVKTDFGMTGNRGSLIFVNAGSPNILGNVTQTPNIQDLYINILPTDPNGEYLTMYQYVLVNGETVWQPVAKIGPDTYSEKLTSVGFNLGISETILVSLSSVTSRTDVTASNLNVQASIESPNGIVTSSISSLSLASGVISINLNAAMFLDNAWSLLNGSFSVSITITVV